MHEEDMANSSIHDLEENLFPRLKLTWGFHCGFTIRVQFHYLLHLIKINRFSSSKKDYIPKINIGQTIQFCKCVWFATKFHVLNRASLNAKVLIAGYGKNAFDINNSRINIYADPVNKILTERGIDTRIFYLDQPHSDDPLAKQLFQYFKKLTFIEYFMFALRSKLFRYEKKQLRILAQNEKLFQAWLEDRNIQNARQISAIITNAVIRNQIYFKAIDRLTNLIKPKFIWTYNFYDNDISAISRVANKRGIKIIEYQHSQQSDHHFAYSHWGNIDEVRDFMPSTFWVWRNSDRQRIIKNFSGSLYKPEVIPGGNLWLADHTKTKISQPQEKAILISLQGLWIPPFIEDYIKTETGFTWYFRLHPRYPTDKDKLIELHHRFPDRVVYDEANKLPLYELLNIVSINITSYSGVALEAYSFGVRNIIFAEQGYHTFKEYIENNVFDFVKDYETFKMAMKKEYIKTDFDPILTDEKEIGKYLTELLK